MSCRTVSPHKVNDVATIDDEGHHESGAKCAMGEGHSDEKFEDADMGSRERETQEESTCRECDPMDEEIDDEAEEEAEPQRPLRDPGMPSPREVIEHNLSHIPPRPWCPHCVRGKLQA